MTPEGGVPSVARARTRLARSERRNQIVDAAAYVLRTREPADVTFEEIADAAGVSRALLYNYFGDRQRLLEAVESRHLDELEQRVTSSVEGTTSYEAALAACVRAHLDAADGNPAGYRLLAERAVRATRDAYADRILGPVLGSQGRLLRVGALAAVQAMVLAAEQNGSLQEQATATAITDFLAGALADDEPITNA